MRMVVSTELVPLISAFNAEDPASAVLAAEMKVSGYMYTSIQSAVNPDTIGDRIRWLELQGVRCSCFAFNL